MTHAYIRRAGTGIVRVNVIMYFCVCIIIDIVIDVIVPFYRINLF